MPSQLRILALCLISTIIWTKGFASVTIRQSGSYESNHCDVDVICQADTTEIDWKVDGRELPNMDIGHIPGLTLRNRGMSKQTLTIRFCYGDITVTCKAESSTAQLTLHYSDSTSSTLPMAEIVGIVFGVMAFFMIVIGIIVFRRRYRNRALLIVAY